MCRDITSARLLLTLVQLLAGLVRIKPTNAIVDAESCWNESQECLIHATLHRMDEPPHSAGLTMEIDCRQTKAEMPAMDGNNNAPAFLLRRLEHAKSLLLDGCHTPLGVRTYGMEYMPNCDTVPQVFMERFHGDTLLPFNCPSGGNNSAMAVEMLHYSNNELATIAADTFVNLPQLRELYFARNSLRHIAPAAFDTLRVVERIQIVDEPSLALKDADLFERTGVADLQLLQLKYITSGLFVHLPETLRQIVVARTTFANDAVIVSNPQLLRNISINGCTLKTFVLRESVQTMSVKYINLRDNALTEFRVEFLSGGVANNNTSIASVETLDLSANELTRLPLSWLHGLSKLRYLLLRDNCLVALALPSLIDAIPLVVLLDLRGNQLTTLADAALVATALSWAQVHIKIDRNPWSCLWLLEFAHAYPEKFRVFQYEKFISQINVNGLKCVPAEVSTQPAYVTESSTNISATTEAPLIEVTTYSNAINASTYKLIYGGPWDYKRSQRAEALVIVFMLPVGVALLFILLYMWIKCQKVFHLSFYRSFTWSQSNIGRRFASAERFDIVRQLPPLPSALNVNNNHHNNNDDYETPLNGIDSVCNCNNIGTPTYTNEKCRKLHHITYEELPSERPYKIYEEIIGDDATDTETYAQPFYDHLSFTQPARSDSD